jgi:hypothetical protein
MTPQRLALVLAYARAPRSVPVMVLAPLTSAPNVLTPDWAAFLSQLDGTPPRVVTDGHSGTIDAVNALWPDADHWRSEWHLQAALRDYLRKATLHGDTREARALRTAAGGTTSRSSRGVHASPSCAPGLRMAFTNVDAYAAAIRDWLLIHGGRPRVERRAVTDHDEASLLSPAVLKAQEAGAGGEGRPPTP